jgi:hypothetical protein
MDSEIDAQELLNDINNGTVFIEGESNMGSNDGSMYQIRENEEENNSFENARKTYGGKRPKSLDDFEGETPDD